MSAANLAGGLWKSNWVYSGYIMFYGFRQCGEVGKWRNISNFVRLHLTTMNMILNVYNYSTIPVTQKIGLLKL